MNAALQEAASPEGDKWEPPEVIGESQVEPVVVMESKDSDTQSLWPYLLSSPAEYKSIQQLLLYLQEIGT